MPTFTWKDHQIYYRQQGQGPLLLVLPGNTASSVFHRSELAYFSDRFQVAALDFLGTGGSDRLDRWVADWWEQGAAQARALAAHLGFTDFLVMGTSGGAVVALLTAALYPGQVRAVIADSCTARFTRRMAQRLRRERAQRTPDQVHFWREAQGEDWEAVIAADTDMLSDLAQRGGDWFSGRLGEIRCPVLLTASKQDESLGHAGRQLMRLSDQISDCQTHLAARGGHPLMWSAPQDFRPICDYFLHAIAAAETEVQP